MCDAIKSHKWHFLSHVHRDNCHVYKHPKIIQSRFLHGMHHRISSKYFYTEPSRKTSNFDSKVPREDKCSMFLGKLFQWQPSPILTICLISNVDTVWWMGSGGLLLPRMGKFSLGSFFRLGLVCYKYNPAIKLCWLPLYFVSAGSAY